MADPGAHADSPPGVNGTKTKTRGCLPRWWEGWKQKQIYNRDTVTSSIADASWEELEREIDALVLRLSSSGVTAEDLRKAVVVAKDGEIYYNISRGHFIPPQNFPHTLDNKEKEALVSERERLFSQGKMFRVILTVSLCSFLQGFVQSSINSATLYSRYLGIPDAPKDSLQGSAPSDSHDWPVGGMNCSPYLAAAFIGAPLSLAINQWMGRRGAITISALLIIASSIGSAFAPDWKVLLGVRIIGGVGMGIKAVSAPILASETAVGYWRGSTILQWQLWVAFGIMIGLVVNLIIAGEVHGYNFNAGDLGQEHGQFKAMQGILASPAVPAFLLLIAVCFCYESPRFYMRRGTPNYHPARAYEILLNVRNTKLQALRDVFLIHWSNRVTHDAETLKRTEKQRLTYASRLSMGIRIAINQYRTLFSTRRLRNAVYSSCTVNLAQQLCGINVLAFYSSDLFSKRLGGSNQEKAAMLYSMGFGAINFVFGLFAMRSIDTFGRRPWLLTTLPLMSLFLLIAATMGDKNSHSQLVGFVVFIFFFAAAYSPGLGPIPFTLASESFPMSHREAGASVAVACNLLFAGLLTIFYPKIDSSFTTSGAIGFFAGLNVVAFVLVYLLVEETQRLSLEDLDTIFERPKLEHMAYQLRTYMPYFIKRYLFWRKVEHPATYYQTIMELDEEVEMEDFRHQS